MKKKKWLLIILSVILLLVVLSFFFNDKYFSSGVLFPQPTPTIFPSSTLSVFFPDEPALPRQKYIELAKESLANKLGIEVDEITVVAVNEKKWSDTSLGCPEKGKFYAQVITPGLVLELAAKGKNFIYHAGLERVVSCKDS